MLDRLGLEKVAGIATPLGKVVARTEVATTVSSHSKTMIVVAGRSRRLAVESLHVELRGLISESGSTISTSVPKTLGDVGAALVSTNVDASLLILQAAPNV
jgi:hypothetical protein